MPDQDDLKSYARDLVVHHAGNVEFLSIIEMADGHWVIPDENGEFISDEDARLVDDLINKAEVTVTWADDRDREFEYMLEERTRKRNDPEAEWTPWYNACGYNNKNGGVYTSSNPLKGVMSRSRRHYNGWNWDVEFRVFKRLAVRAAWREAELDA